MDESKRFTRREAVAWSSAGLAVAMMRGRASAASLAPPTPQDVGSVTAGKVTLPDDEGATDPPEAMPPNPASPSDRVGFAVVGLGRLSLENILPAFARTKRAKLVSVVSGSPDKARTVAAQYGLDSRSVYDYASFDRIAGDPSIGVVYIVLPNALHAEYTVRAFRAGKHVLCEKPMALSEAECTTMIDAGRSARRALMIAYRCQYEPNNRLVLDMVRAEKLGPARLIEARNTQVQGDPTQWRLKKAMAGGGPLYDVGIYCLNAARYLTGEEPVEVTGKLVDAPGDPRFREVEQSVQFVLRFPGGTVANCAASYDMHQTRTLNIHSNAGAIRLDNAFAYEGQLLNVNRLENGIETTTAHHLPAKDQFALELDHMADCVTAGTRPRTPGEEGRADVKLMQTIYRSAATGKTILLAPSAGRDSTRGPAIGFAAK
jgi:predicted dehydrogenase